MMKRIVTLVVTLICINITVLCVYAQTGTSAGINDMAGVYTASEIAELEKIQEDLALKTGWNIAVITSSKGYGTNSKAAHNYCQQYYINTFGDNTSGVVYLIDLDIRTIYVHGDAKKPLSLSRLDRILDKTEERYFAYDDMGNLETFYTYIEHYYDLGNDVEITEDTLVQLVIAVLAGIIAGGVSIAVIVHKYKFHHKPTANTYMNRNTLNIYIRQDKYVREYTTRTRISSDSRGGGGSHHHSSGGGHSSSRGGRR